jgi:MFS transporter, DHA1 family, tetracycline resistance protein
MKTISKTKALLSIYFIAAIDNCGYSMVFVLFPSLLLNPEYGFSVDHPTLIQKLIAMGVLYAAFPIAQFIGAPLIGELADRYGRRKLFFATIIGTALGYFLTGAVLSLKSIALVFIARFITGLFSGNLGLCNASIADLSPDEKQRAKNYGILTVVWGISFPVALLLGGFLSDPTISVHFSPSLPFHIVGGITILGLFAIGLFFPETFKSPKYDRFQLDLAKGLRNIVDALRMKSVRESFLLMLLWTLGWDYSITWYGAYSIQKFGVSQESLTLGLIVQGIFWTLGGAVAKPILLKYMSVKRIAQLSFITSAILLGVCAFMPTFHFFIFVYSLASIMGSVSLSSTFNLISISSRADMQGKAMGIGQSIMSLGAFLVPVFGAVTGAISIDTFYPIAALFMALGFVLLISGQAQK